MSMIRRHASALAATVAKLATSVAVVCVALAKAVQMAWVVVAPFPAVHQRPLAGLMLALE